MMQIEVIDNNIYQGACNYLSCRRQTGAREKFSKTSSAALIDALSLHLDLACMIDELDAVELELQQQLACMQHEADGLFYEECDQYTSDHPRVREMAGTYLGFQVGELLLKNDIAAGEFKFWRFLLEPGKVPEYLNAMPWVRSPWGAGGWLDAVSTMVRANIAWGHAEYENVFEQILDWISSNQDSRAGLWGKPDCQGVEGLVNGAYHLLRGSIMAIGKDVPHCEKLIDVLVEYIIEHPLFVVGKGEGCHDLDAFYLLRYLHRQSPTYRADEIMALCSARLQCVATFQNPDGGFGFYPHTSHEIHNYQHVGKKVVGDSDIQGTVFYLTAIKAMMEMAVPGYECQWKFSLTHG